MRNFFWILRSFGFMSALLFVVDSFWLQVRRFVHREKPLRFKHLSDGEAIETAWFSGMRNVYQKSKPFNRQALNKKFENFNRTLH